MEQCKICEKECRNIMQLSLHVKFHHSLTPKQYYDKYLRKPDEGICPVCGQETTFDGIRDGYRKYCRPCIFKDKSVKERLQKSLLENHGGIGFASKEISASVEETCLTKYGVKNYSQTEEYNKRVKAISLERYGKEYYMQTDEYARRAKQTWTQNHGGIGFASPEMRSMYKQLMLAKYGVENAAQSNEVQEKIKQTSLERYGVERPTQSKEVQEKVKQTNLEKYSETSWTKTEEGRAFLRNFVNSNEFKNKQYRTKKKNKSLNTSKPEKELKARLQELFPDLKTQYKSDAYPFACDFYIPSLDMYIEFNGTWTHGGHFFDRNDKGDTDRLAKWEEKAKTSKFFTNAITTWTVRDILKLETAIKNNLNYIAWFNEEQANDWIMAQKKRFVV